MQDVLSGGQGLAWSLAHKDGMDMLADRKKKKRKTVSWLGNQSIVY